MSCASCYLEFRGKHGIQLGRERLASNRRTKVFISGKLRKKKRAANCNWEGFTSRDNNEVELMRVHRVSVKSKKGHSKIQGYSKQTQKRESARYKKQTNDISREEWPSWGTEPTERLGPDGERVRKVRALGLRKKGRISGTVTPTSGCTSNAAWDV